MPYKYLHMVGVEAQKPCQHFSNPWPIILLPLARHPFACIRKIRCNILSAPFGPEYLFMKKPLSFEHFYICIYV